MVQLTVFLPVHNRGRMTGDFIGHIASNLNGLVEVKFVVFDDGCSDNTVDYARHIWPSLTVVKLDGKAYWGGAINAVIDYVRVHFLSLSDEGLYLLANDDIRFCSREALMSALNTVRANSIVCAREIMVPTLNQGVARICDSTLGVSSGIYYDADAGIFCEAKENAVPNVASTWAMLSTKEAWLMADKVPSAIPHYLSDYWLTYNLTRRGFALVQPPGFACYVSIKSTRNNPYTKESFDNWYQKLKIISRGLIEKTSPSYAPAWIRFWSQAPVSTVIRKKIFSLRLRFFVAKLVSILLNI